MGRFIELGLLTACVAFGGVCKMSSPPQGKASTSPLHHRSVTALFPGHSEFYVGYVDASRNELSLREFYENRPDLGEIRFLKEVGWEEPLPKDAELFLPTSGLGRDVLQAFWLGWKQGPKLSLLSIFQDKPLELTLGEKDLFVEPALMMPSKQLHLYALHGLQWQRHEFHGDAHAPARVNTVSLSALKSLVLLPAAGSIPESKKDEAVLAWVETDGAGVRVVIAWVEGTAMKQKSSQVLEGYRILERQRVALFVDAAGSVSYRFWGEGLKDKTYATLQVSCRQSEEVCALTATPVEGLEPGIMESAASFFYKGPLITGDFARKREAGSFGVVLAKGGVLFREAEGVANEIRRDVPSTYDFPIVTGEGAAYEPKWEKGKPNLVPFP